MTEVVVGHSKLNKCDEDFGHMLIFFTCNENFGCMQFFTWLLKF
jgi:hypothetical protein